MTYNYRVIQDGQMYNPGEDVPDMGSLVATNVNGNIRDYAGLSSDFAKLPKYDNLGTGSSFFTTDTSELYQYEATTKTWYKA